MSKMEFNTTLDDLDGQERIQIDSEAYEYCMDQIGITEDEEMEELNFE